MSFLLGKVSDLTNDYLALNYDTRDGKAVANDLSDFIANSNISLISQNELLKREIISRVIDSIDAHNQLEFEMYRSERNENNEFIEGKFYAKLVNRPYKIYIKNEKPRKGAEVLYVDGENDGNFKSLFRNV